MTRKFFALITTILIFTSCMEHFHSTPEAWTTFESYPIYKGEDLGLQYTKSKSTFRLWAPTAHEVKLSIYENDLNGHAIQEINMDYTADHIWKGELAGDQAGKFYTFSIMQKGEWLEQVPDPYAKAVGTNGKRAQILDLKNTDPVGWEKDQRPILKSPTDIILYELHIRDLSIAPNSGNTAKGKFIALTETGTKNSHGLSTGIDHLKELGITHLHILPSYDFMSIDESKLDEPQFNWGYDPHNYNVPEGSYSTNPADGATRIREFKQMVQALHAAGIRVVMDVVYNHTGKTENSIFNQLVPGYYYRQNEDQSFSNASGCGNETSSDRPMTRKMIVESVKYWVNEYHIDGFRFDLMAIHDIQTMNEVAEELHKIDSTIYVYGEGWTAGDSPLPVEHRALKHHVPQLVNVAAFSDDLRDGVKGSVFNHDDKGFASGKKGMEETIKFGVIAATQHPQINYQAVNYSDAFWAPQPSQCINYVSCHDNHTLYDRLKNSNAGDSEEEIEKMHRLAQTIVLTSQGVPFLHAGTEFLRTKGGEENSYKSPDAVNQLDWDRKTKYKATFDYYAKLINLRKNHEAFRLHDTKSLTELVHFLDRVPEQMVAYTIDAKAAGDSYDEILVIFNGSAEAQTLDLPKGSWQLVGDGVSIDEKGFGAKQKGSITLPGRTPYIMIKK